MVDHADQHLEDGAADPLAPAAAERELRRGRRPPSTMVGDIIDATRMPGGAAWKPSGCRSSSPSMLLSRMPVPGTTSPEHSPFDVVIDATLPSSSATLTWVVPRVGLGPVRVGRPARLATPVDVGHQSRPARPPAPANPAGGGGPPASSRGSARAMQRTTERRRRVGEHRRGRGSRPPAARARRPGRRRGPRR